MTVDLEAALAEIRARLQAAHPGVDATAIERTPCTHPGCPDPACHQAMFHYNPYVPPVRVIDGQRRVVGHGFVLVDTHDGIVEHRAPDRWNAPSVQRLAANDPALVAKMTTLVDTALEDCQRHVLPVE